MIGRKKYELRIHIHGESVEGSNMRVIEETLKTVLREKRVENVGWLDEEDGIKLLIVCSNGEFDEICRRIMNLHSQKDRRFFINWHEKRW